jgi:hypothetical protein
VPFLQNFFLPADIPQENEPKKYLKPIGHRGFYVYLDRQWGLKYGLWHKKQNRFGDSGKPRIGPGLCRTTGR